MTRSRRVKTTGGVSTACPVCGGSTRSGMSSEAILPAALVLVGSVISFYLVGLLLVALGVGLAVRRDRCVCARA